MFATRVFDKRDLHERNGEIGNGKFTIKEISIYRANREKWTDSDCDKILLAFVSFEEHEMQQIPKCIQFMDQKSILQLPLPGDRVQVQILKSVISQSNGQRDFIRVVRMQNVTCLCVIKKLKVLPSQFHQDSYYIIIQVQNSKNETEKHYEIKGTVKASTVLKLSSKLYDGTPIELRRSAQPIKSSPGENSSLNSLETYRFFRLGG